MPTPIGSSLLDEVPRVMLFEGAGAARSSRGHCDRVAAPAPVALLLRWLLSGVASATLYLSSLRSFHGWEKITVFADDNAIN